MLSVFADIDALFLGVAAAAGLLAGTARGFSGFGAALISSPVLALLFGPVVAVPVMSLMEVPVLVQVARIALRDADWRRCLPMGAVTVVAIPAGTYLLTTLDPDLLRRVISIVVLGLVAVMAAGGLPAIRGSRTGEAMVAGIGGLGSGAVGIGGPPVVLYFLATGEAARRVRGDLFGYFFVTSLVGMATFFAYGLFTAQALAIAVAVAPFYMAGMWLGAKLFPLASERTFRRIALAILTCVGVGTLLR